MARHVRATHGRDFYPERAVFMGRPNKSGDDD